MPQGPGTHSVLHCVCSSQGVKSQLRSSAILQFGICASYHHRRNAEARQQATYPSFPGSRGCSPKVAEQISLPPQGHMLTAPRASQPHSNNSRSWLCGGNPTPTSFTSNLFMVQNWGAGGKLNLAVNLLLRQDGESILKRAFKTRKQFNFCQAPSTRSGAVTQLLNKSPSGGWERRRGEAHRISRTNVSKESQSLHGFAETSLRNTYLISAKLW